MDLASVIGALDTTGVTAYEIAQGAPVSVTQATAGGVLSVGASATANAYLPIIIVIALALVAYFAFKG